MAGPLKRSIRVEGHRTSLSLEPQFWNALKELAKAKAMSVSSLIGEIDRRRGNVNLSSAIRIFILNEALDGRLRR
jgi:predicted DNA-binding ribbon-helix-helix protein